MTEPESMARKGQLMTLWPQCQFKLEKNKRNIMGEGGRISASQENKKQKWYYFRRQTGKSTGLEPFRTRFEWL